MTKIVKPPKFLKKTGREFWRATIEEFDFQDFHLRLLAQACECLDRQQEARDLVEREGMVIQTAMGVKAHPALGVERDQKKLFAQLVRELRLDHDTGKENQRPRLPEGR